MNKENKKRELERRWEKKHFSSRQSPGRMRARRRRLRMWILYTLMTIAVLGVGVALSLTVLFKIDSIEVTGETRYDPQQIIALSTVEPGQNLFLCKTREGKEAIEQNLSYIESAEINRKLPSKIEIHVQEAVPVGLVEYQDQYVVISSSGKVLEYTGQRQQDLPVIKGLKVSSAELGRELEYEDSSIRDILENITEAITLTGIKDILEIDLTTPTNPTLNYQDRITIKLGQPIDLIIKLRNAIAILQPPHVEDYEKGTLDLALTQEDRRSFFRPEYGESSTEPESEPTSSTAADSVQGSSSQTSIQPESGEEGVSS